MAKHGKRYLEAAKKVDSTKFYSVDEAMKLAKETSYANFDATIEVAYNLNVDPKQADQQIRGALVLQTVLVNLRRLLFLLKVHKLTKLKKQVLTKLVLMI